MQSICTAFLKTTFSRTEDKVSTHTRQHSALARNLVMLIGQKTRRCKYTAHDKTFVFVGCFDSARALRSSRVVNRSMRFWRRARMHRETRRENFFGEANDNAQFSSRIATRIANPIRDAPVMSLYRRGDDCTRRPSCRGADDDMTRRWVARRALHALPPQPGLPRCPTTKKAGSFRSRPLHVLSRAKRSLRRRRYFGWMMTGMRV